MTINADTIQLQYLKPGKSILAALLTVLLISGCASSPKQEIDPAQENANEMFEQAREAYREFDYTKAIALLNTTAAQGDANAQYALGYMYYYGFGVIRDEYIALAWIEKAAARGHTKAITALDRVKIIEKYEQGKTVIDARPKANLSAEPDLHTQQMMQTETIGPDQTVLPTTEDIPPSTAIATPVETKLDTPSKVIETKAIESGAVETQAEQTPDTSSIEATTTTPGQDWIRNQNPDHYTIQVISSRNEQRIKKYMEKHGLTRQSAHFGLQRADQSVIYIGVYGVYSSVAEAKQILQSLPDEVKDVQPWIRSFKSIQAELR